MSPPPPPIDAAEFDAHKDLSSMNSTISLQKQGQWFFSKGDCTSSRYQRRGCKLFHAKVGYD